MPPFIVMDLAREIELIFDTFLPEHVPFLAKLLSKRIYTEKLIKSKVNLNLDAFKLLKKTL